MNASSEWHQAALAAAKKADAFSLKQVVEIMAYEEVPQGEMDEWCEQCRYDQPCLFKVQIVGRVISLPREGRK